MQHQRHRVPKEELCRRLRALRSAMDAQEPGWSAVLIHHKINMYYLTGTMQVGVLVVRPESATLWVRRSYERALSESEFADIRLMKSFRTLSEFYPNFPETVYLETKTATMEWLGLISKYLPIRQPKSIHPIIDGLRHMKSEYELGCMRESGRLHAEVMETIAPTLLREGVSEAELGSLISHELLIRGGHGIARFNQPSSEDVIGFVSFAESSLMTTAFDGPGGNAGTCIAVPSIGSHANKLSAGQLVYLDIPCGIEGYHTDKSIVYYFGKLSDNPNGETIRKAYTFCRQLEQEIAARLVPGASPEDIYLFALDNLPPEYAAGFMNGGKFLGHSIGLTMDEPPVLAKGFREPVREGMTFAIEPKIALPGIGLVGSENTYLVTSEGAVSLTGNSVDLQEIY